jgi:hypothetical protein
MAVTMGASGGQDLRGRLGPAPERGDRFVDAEPALQADPAAPVTVVIHLARATGIAGPMWLQQ